MITSKLCLNNCGRPVATGSNRTGRFCSRSCSNSYNNRVSPKRQARPRQCSWADCDALVYRPITRCLEHKGLKSYSNAKTNGMYMASAKDLTLGKIKHCTGLSGDSFAKYLRHWARKIAAQTLPHTTCDNNCGYLKSTVLAHVKPLSDFSDDDTLRSTFENNLVRLCRNCHWEFDEGLLIYVPETGFEPA